MALGRLARSTSESSSSSAVEPSSSEVVFLRLEPGRVVLDADLVVDLGVVEGMGLVRGVLGVLGWAKSQRWRIGRGRGRWERTYVRPFVVAFAPPARPLPPPALRFRTPNCSEMARGVGLKSSLTAPLIVSFASLPKALTVGD